MKKETIADLLLKICKWLWLTTWSKTNTLMEWVTNRQASLRGKVLRGYKQLISRLCRAISPHDCTKVNHLKRTYMDHEEIYEHQAQPLAKNPIEIMKTVKKTRHHHIKAIFLYLPQTRQKFKVAGHRIWSKAVLSQPHRGFTRATN